jgi:hypothetical protein
MKETDTYCVNCKMVLWKHGLFLIRSKEIHSLKYINDVKDNVAQAGICIQFKKRCVNIVKLAKGENISNIVY